MLTITELQRRAGRIPKHRQHTPTDLREMLLEALSMAGGVKYLAQRAIDTPGPFLALLGKILPTTVQSTDGSPIHLHMLAAQLVSQEILATMQSPPTIDARQEPPANLLDAPPATE